MIKLKTLILSAGCILCWIVLFPLVVLGGGLALFMLAAGTELSHLIIGTTGKDIDPSVAHDMAMRICFGYRAQARYPSRLIR